MPLTFEQIKGVAPAVFQEAAAPHMSTSYAYIPTIRVLETLVEQGFTVHEVAQARPHKTDNDPYMKHMVRLRMPVKAKKVGDIVTELVLINAHNGTARYYLYAGLYRMICSNGMMAGETISSLVVAHRAAAYTKHHVLEGSYRIVEEEFPRLLQARDVMQQVTLSPVKQLTLASQAMSLRYPTSVPPFKPEQLLESRRPQDDGDTLWNVFNRIQENVIDGGMKSVSAMYGRVTTIRPIERVDQRVKINRGLWDAAMALTA
jgi:hypothetical protein